MPPVRITGDFEGVQVTVWRATDPLALFDAIEDPRRIDLAGGPLEARMTEGTGEFEVSARVTVSAKAPLRLPTLPAGLYLVVARRGERSACALLPVGNLVLVTKRSRDEVLVYVADAETGSPVPLARVVVAGPGARAAGLSDAVGVFRTSLRPGSRARVLVRTGDQVAIATPVHYPGTAEGPIGYVYTDRPAYRPGETVHFKAILRVREGGGYRLPENRPARFRAVDARDAVLAEGEVEGSARGSAWGSFVLPRETGLGTLRVHVTAGERTFAGEATVESYVRPSFEVAVLLSATEVVRGDEVDLTMRATYFSGGAIVGAKARYRVVREADPGEQGPSAPVVVSGDATLDERGEVRTRFPTASAGTYRVVFEVTDRAGMVAEGRATVHAAAAEFTLQVVPDRLHYLPGSVRTPVVTIRPVFTAGREVPVTGELLGGGKTYPFELTAEDSGREYIPVPLPEPGRHRLVATARDGRGNEVSGEAVVWVSAGGDIQYEGEGIRVIPDREEYAPGDTAEVLVLLPPALEGATLLQTVEGTGIGAHTVEALESRSLRVSTPIPGNLGSHLIFAVAAVRGGRGHYGRCRVRVPPRDSLLTVRVTTDREDARPGETVTAVVELTGPDGAPASGEVSLAVYDDALNALYPDAAPRIEEFLFGPTRHDVATNSSRIGIFLGRSGPHEPGGDPTPEPAVDPTASDESGFGFGEGEGRSSKAESPGGSAPPVNRTDFAPLAFWAPRIFVDGTSPPQEIVLPDDLTRWRLVAVAATAETRVGTGEATVRATLPVSVRLGLPRFLVEGDLVKVRAVARNDTDLEVRGSLTFWAERLLLMGPALKQVRLAPGGGEGGHVVDVSARRPGTARMAAELAAKVGDRVERSLPVLPRAVARSATVAGALEEGTNRFSLELPPEGTLEGAKLSIYLSAGPAAAVLQALPTLIDYPYGCTEQTLSRFVPDVVALAAVRELGLTPPPDVLRAGTLARAGLARLYALQHEDGGWGWWEADASDLSMTAMVVSGLSLCARADIPVSEERLSRGKENLLSLLRQLGQGEQPEAAARALEALAAAGMARKDIVEQADRLFDLVRRKELSPVASAHLLVALLAAGERGEAVALDSWLAEKAREDEYGRSWWGREGVETAEEDPVECTAVVLRARLSLPGRRKDGHVDRAVRFLLESREGPAWKSTRDTAAACLALLQYLKKRGAGEGDHAVFGLSLPNGRPVRGLRLTRKQLLLEGVSIDVPPRYLRKGRNPLVLSKAGDLDVDFVAHLTYMVPRPRFAPRREGFSVSRTTRRLEIRRRRTVALPLGEPAKAKRGSLLAVTVRVSADRPREFVVVDCPIPAGTEPIHVGEEWAAAFESAPEGSHVERRDDRVTFFLRHLDEQKVELSYLLRTTHSGRFQVLPAQARLMYFPTARGNSAEEILFIVE